MTPAAGTVPNDRSEAPAGTGPSEETGYAPDHYSYTVYADRGMAERFHALRFGGPIGELLAETQERTLAEFLDPVEGRRVLDVGVGTGRAAIALAQRGGRVTGVDASEQMLQVAARRAQDQGASVDLRVGDAHALAFADQSFDAAVSLRVLMHTPDWRRCLSELCRVARDRVVFDYPALCSVAALQAAARHVVHALGGQTEAYRVFRARDIQRELSEHGFVPVAWHRQFVLPIALHKRVGSRGFTERTESVLARVGLLERLGSPVTVAAKRCES